MSPVLVTGCAGFVGFHATSRLLAAGESVIGVDVLDPWYDLRLKHARLARLSGEGFTFHKVDLGDPLATEALFERHRPGRVLHLAAQAGVRHSLEAPRKFIQANVSAFLNVLEGCRSFPVEHLVYASSSSVYGANAVPSSPHVAADHPLSLYAATKRADELMAHAYSALFGIPSTGARLFTVYGPWVRPDMAISQFTRSILAGEPIRVFNHGRMRRDFTYVDDVVEGLLRLLASPPRAHPDWDPAHPDPASSPAPWRLVNLGNGQPRSLLDYIDALEKIGRAHV